ncbi:lipopolysaccharide biosynthesis protein [Chitinophaga sp. Mgbs1]|uniref:Lipopolysaccharide biosynthesis protein n=1 Tax=Chitinophaga solisilvae TaxID=1233460 RepID=A0A433WE18_9BACT|nr:lipopolysaccharide biosynthesis protein [Chitinophaga solisilvae]
MQQHSTYTTGNQRDGEEISLKDFLLKIQQLWRYLLQKWKVILIVGLLGGGLGLLFSFLSKKKYIGKLTFIVEDSKGGALGAYMGIASQFGIDLGGGAGGSDVFSNDNVIAFLKSRLILEKTLLSPVEVDGKKGTLADLYVDFNELHKKWEKIPALKSLNYPLGQDRKKFTLKQDSVLNTIQGTIVDKLLEITKPDKKSSFIQVKCTTRNEIFSKVFTETLVQIATQFYIEIKTQRSKKNVDKLQIAADSLKILLNNKTYTLASTQDLNVNPAKRVASVNAEVQARDKMVLQTMYAEVVKNLEITKMAMEQETPITQIVDTPIYPLEFTRLGKLKGIILGGLIGGMLAVIVLLLRKVYRDVLTD